MPILETRQSFERYRIIQWLGSSVSGESYEAEDTLLHRKVTLKLIHPATILPDAARRLFFREMQGISMLNHTHLAQVLNDGEFDGKLYVARRFVSAEKNSALLPITAAPEQFFKRSIPASDQFALAVILYYWLLGHLPLQMPYWQL